ncbi:MAG: helicase [Halobacteriales archaeon]
MEIDAIPLDGALLHHFREQGIGELYPPQAAAIEAGVAEGEDAVLAVPTATGKTFVAQVAMLTADGPALYVVPLRALATEKYEEFSALPGVSVGIATGDYDATEADLAGEDIVVATSEKVDAALRNDADWVAAVGCVVVDEIHLLDAEGRGPTLEMVLAGIRRRAPTIQIVGLSATVGNAAAIADWLDATLVADDWRPVELRRGIFADGTIAFEDGAPRQVSVDDEPTEALVSDAVDDGGQCLVFVRSRREARELAADLAETGFAFPGEATEEIRETARTGAGMALARAVAQGVAFHHAGLRTEHRLAVEKAFRDREVKVICATPTLAAGVNVPARRVVVRDLRRYTDDGPSPLPTLEVHQMMGRAGRPGLDPYGEAVLVAGRDDPADVRARYLKAEPEPVESKLPSPRPLRTHVLATVAAGGVDSRAELRGVLEETFYAHQHGVETLDEDVADAIASLEAVGLLASGKDGLEATDLGALVSRVYVDPTTGTDVVAALERAAGLEQVGPLTVLEIICDTPDLRTEYVRDDEAGDISEFAIRNADRIAKDVTDFEGDFHEWLSALKTALLLRDVVEGLSEDELSERYGVGPGDVTRLVERAAWLLGATDALAGHVDGEGMVEVRKTIRDVREELVERTG